MKREACTSQDANRACQQSGSASPASPILLFAPAFRQSPAVRGTGRAVKPRSPAARCTAPGDQATTNAKSGPMQGDPKDRVGRHRPHRNRRRLPGHALAGFVHGEPAPPQSGKQPFAPPPRSAELPDRALRSHSSTSSQRFINGPEVKPLTPKEKARLAVKNLLDPFNAITILGTAAIAVGLRLPLPLRSRYVRIRQDMSASATAKT